MSASLIGRLGSSAFRLSIAPVLMSLVGLVLLFGLGAKALVWGFLSQAGRRIFPLSVSWFDLARSYFDSFDHDSECPLLAQSEHPLVHCTCPLSGAKQT
jgi:hypothetical protein